MFSIQHRRALICGAFLAVVTLSSTPSNSAPMPVPRLATGAHVPQNSRGYAREQTYSTDGLRLFETDVAYDHVAIYNARFLKRNPKPIATITDGIMCPSGIAIDSTGTLYVSSDCSARTVTEYPKGQTVHTVTISDGTSYPGALTVDSNNTLYVANYPPAITEYPFGSTSPSQTITDSRMANLAGLALDKHGDLFVADGTAIQVFEIPAGTQQVRALNLQDLTEPTGVAVDNNGNLWVTDGAGKKINVYAPGSTTPSQTIVTSYFTDPYAISIDKRGTVVISNGESPVAVYAYQPGQFTPYATLTRGLATPGFLLLAAP